MKKFFILLIITSFFSCKKEQTSTLSGEWKLVKSCSDSGCASVDQAYSFNVRFENDGTLKVSGTYNWLAEFDHYQLIDDQTVRFYNAAGNSSLNALFYFEDGLHLSYFPTRGANDYFVPSNVR